MRRPGRWKSRAGVAAICTLAVLLTLPAGAESGVAVSLNFPARLTPDIEAMPRLTGNGAAAARINARLAKWDVQMLTVARGCDTDPPRSMVRQDVELVFAGPLWLGLLTYHEYWCPGASHGAHFTVPLTLDLSSGSEVDWPALFPAALLDPEGQGSGHGALRGSEALTALYLSQADDFPPECRGAMGQNGGYFRVWPSAADRALALLPTGLAHSEMACAQITLLPASVLRAEGFPRALTDALENAAPLPAP